MTRSTMPTRRIDATEAIANATIGLLVSWSATYFVLGYTPVGSAAVTLMFTGLSFARAYILRRIFRVLK